MGRGVWVRKGGRQWGPRRGPRPWELSRNARGAERQEGSESAREGEGGAGRGRRVGFSLRGEMRGAERQKGGGHVLSGKRGRRGSGGSGIEGVDVGGVVLLDTAPLQLHGRRQHPVFGGPGVIVETEPGDLLERL